MKTPAPFSETRAGRVLLHLACLIRTRRFRWHFQGIVREISHHEPV